MAQAEDRRRRAGEVGSALAVEVRQRNHSATRQDVVSIQVQPLRHAINGERAVESAGEWQEKAGCVGEAGDIARYIRSSHRRNHEGHAGRAEAQNRRPGLEAESECGAHVVACARADDRPDRQSGRG